MDATNPFTDAPPEKPPETNDGPKLYRINEIFLSLQGEGARAGTATVFLRFAGCNLSCPYCDTDHASARAAWTIIDLMREVHKVGGVVRDVTLTGGEPMLQVDGNLLDALKMDGYTIALETNGTIKSNLYGKMQWVVVSPKPQADLELRGANEVRVVVPDTAGPFFWGWLEGMRVFSFSRYLSPATHSSGIDRDGNLPWDGTTLERVIGYIKANPQWRLSVQQHKIWGIR